MLFPALSKAKAKANRIKCVNNLGSIGKSHMGFTYEYDGFPWQLQPAEKRQLFGTGGHDQTVGGIFGLPAMKAELQTARILVSPCDPDRMAANESLQENWRSYDTKANGVSAELGNGCSYVLVRGADTMRPSSVYGLTRNWSSDNLNTGNWLGSDSDWGNERTMAGLRASQGQCVTMDGAAMQTTNADFGGFGRRTQQAQVATGGVARGTTSLNLIRGSGL